VKFFSPASLLMCALVLAGLGPIGISKANAAVGGAVISGSPVQDAAQENSAAPSLSGNWQMSWTAANGNQRQITMEIKQDGNKLSGKFETERGSATLKGSLQGNQVSFSVKLPRRQASFTGTVEGNKMSGTTEQGAPWTASRQ
jgi:hypothetical protein